MTTAKTQQENFQFDQALLTYKQATQVAPGDLNVTLAYARAARALWHFRDVPTFQQQADAAYERARLISPSSTLPAFEHAQMYAFKEQYARALTLLEPALTLDPNNAGYWLERARYLAASGQETPAITAYRRCWAIDIVPECEAGLKTLGVQP
ncbi:BTAD domain-containing putative transcriptional regulator [Deinococcus seoulensis]|nr:BTAD domain-containing putative transcriptional regulator [Deinococcus seoulensis]